MFAAKPAAAAVGAVPAAAVSPAPGPPQAAKKRSEKPREHSKATECRIIKYDAYRKKCSEDEKKQKDSCTMVKQCKQHGVGSEMWPVELWHLDEAKFKAVNEKFDPNNGTKAVLNGKRCMNDVMRADEKFVKEIEAECGAFEKKKSAKPPAVPPAAAAAAKPKSIKPPVKLPSNKPPAKPASNKPKVSVKPPKAVSGKPKPAAAAAVKPKLASVKPKPGPAKAA